MIHSFLHIHYYPYSIENQEFYLEKLRETARIPMESDIRSYHEMGPDMVLYLIKFLSILADTVHFNPNITKLNQRIGTSRNTVINYSVTWKMHNSSTGFAASPPASPVSRSRIKSI